MEVQLAHTEMASKGQVGGSALIKSDRSQSILHCHFLFLGLRPVATCSLSFGCVCVKPESVMVFVPEKVRGNKRPEHQNCVPEKEEGKVGGSSKRKIEVH